ncbi:MAG: hypothetical protein ACREYF_17100, partial [Gammaproteobacteria bacterium]
MQVLLAGGDPARAGGSLMALGRGAGKAPRRPKGAYVPSAFRLRFTDMDIKRSHRGRIVTDEDLAFIRTLIAGDPAASRRALSQQLCAVELATAKRRTARDGVPGADAHAASSGTHHTADG